MSAQPESLWMTRDMVFSLVRLPLYSPIATSALPFAISESALGRWQALIGLGVAAEPSRAGEIAMGMHFSVVCAEDFPRIKLALDAPDKDFGIESGRSYERICTDWPRAEMPAAFYTVPQAGATVLLLSGGLDPVTPPRHGERMARALGARAQHVVVANAGHGVMLLPCMRDVLARFIDAEDDAQAQAVDSACVKQVPRPNAFVPFLEAAP
jgi:pimeloyl-ACP methyl ester carboxylesterase